MNARRVDRTTRRPEAGRIAFGGDYNPEQWPEDVWPRDVDLMRQAGVTLVTVGVFAWARIEPREGERDLDWLGRVLDLLHEGGIVVDLATPVSSPPPWLGHRYPDTLPVMPDGTVLHAGSRNHFCPSSENYRRAARAITTDLAGRFAGHPAVRMWHLGNEYGQFCWCDRTAEAFRRWLRERYLDLDGLNTAWGTSFWSQAYAAWDEILPPRSAPYLINPGLDLDFKRFCSDALLACYREQAAIVRAADPDAVLTTNFMGFFAGVDPWSWAAHLDLVSNDVYLDPADPRGHVDVAMTHDLSRGLAARCAGAGAGRSWLLMEHATGAVNWRPHNVAKPAGRIALDALQAVARGAGGIGYFQWRQSRFGAELAHSAMLPNAGPDTRIHREVRHLGAVLARLSEHAPSLGLPPDTSPGASADPSPGPSPERYPRPRTGVQAEVALLVDWPSRWASGHRSLPSDRLDAHAQLRRWYAALHAATITADVVGPESPLGDYRLVLVPQLFLTEPETAERLTAYVEAGGRLVVGPFSGVVDGAARLGEGRFPSALRDLLGVSGEEWRPLAVPQPCTTDAIAFGGPLGGPAGGLTGFTADTWAEHLRCDGAHAVASYAGPDAVLAGNPALTRHEVGSGTAWYLSTVPDDAALEHLVRFWAEAAGAAPVLPEPVPGVEAVRRDGLTFVLNHNGSSVAVALPGAALTDLLTGGEHTGELVLAPYAAAVLRPRPPESSDTADATDRAPEPRTDPGRMETRG